MRKWVGQSAHPQQHRLPEQPARNYFAAEANANFPGNPTLGLPTIQRVALLFDADNGNSQETEPSEGSESVHDALTIDGMGAAVRIVHNSVAISG